MAYYPLFCFSFSLLTSSAMGFNITKILDQYPEFSTFNNLLSQTQVADQINSRNTITVLALDNDAAAVLSRKPAEVLKMLVGVHVVLDYYDKDKISQLSKKTAILTTLFQSSGKATGQQGFLKVSVLYNGEVAIGSAVAGSSRDSRVLKLVTSQHYNVSVLQISAAVIPAGMDNTNASTPTTTTSPAASPESSVAPAVDAPKISGIEDGPAMAPESSGGAADAPIIDSPPSPAAPAGAPGSDEIGEDPSAESPGPIAPDPGADDIPEEGITPGASGPSSNEIETGPATDSGAPAPATEDDLLPASRVAAGIVTFVGLAFVAAAL